MLIAGFQLLYEVPAIKATYTHSWLIQNDSLAMLRTSVVSVDVVASVVLVTTPTTATHPTLMRDKLLAKSLPSGPLFTDSYPIII